MNKEILYVENLTTNQLSAQNIDHVTFSLEQGSILGITGLLNSGITALAGALCGEIPVCCGTVYLEDRPLRLTSRAQANRLGIFRITQDQAVIPTLTISENLNIFKIQNHRNFIIDPKTNSETTRAVFERYGIGGDPDGLPASLTVGQLSQLSICRAVICGAKVLVCYALGEGASEADLSSLRRFLQMLRDEGLSILLVTPDARKALLLSDRVAVMRSGMICYMRDTAEASLDEMVRHMALQRAKPQAPVHAGGGAGSRFHIQKLAVAAPMTHRTPITVELQSGTSVGLFWPDGNYGSDIKKAFLGQIPASGTVEENGRTEPFQSWRKRNRYGIACLGIRFWEQDLQEYMSVGENLLLRVYHRYHRRLGILNPSMLALALQEFSASHGLKPEYLDCYPRYLPPELRNQVVLWSVLFAAPKLLVLDCPMFTMDEQIRLNFFNALEELKANNTAILWSDNGEFPKYHCDSCLQI